jgi:putative tricarboxylic transport membrane protein
MITDFIQFVPTLMLGIFSGILTGIIPGIGPAQLLIVLYAVLMHIDPLHLMIFYIALLLTSQVVDVIPAMYLGIPGETSSIATAYEGPYCVNQNQDRYCLQKILVGRFVATIIAIILTFLMVTMVDVLSQLFATKWQFMFLIMAFVGVLVSSSGKKGTVIASMIAGLLLGLVGFRYTVGGNFLTFGIQELEQGIPLIAFGFSALIIPFFYRQFSLEYKSTLNNTVGASVDYVSSRWTYIRSSVLGWVLGLVPGLSYVVSASGSYSLEKKIQIAKKQYYPGNTNCIVANETGNTAGSISTLLPLLIFGIPITASEVLIFDLMTKNGAIFSRANFFQTHVEYLLITVVISMMLASLAASLLVNNLQTVKKLINAKQVFLFAILLALLTIIYYCYANNIVLLGILGLFLGAAMGWILRYSDITPALFMFVLAEPADRTIFNVMQLYF